MPLLKVSNLTKTFGTNSAVKDAQFTIDAGRCVALLGPNGAGKTTILKMLTGLLAPTEGQIQYKGLKKGDDFRRFIGYLPQQPVFYHWMTGYKFLTYAGKLSHLSHQEATERAKELLKLVGIEDAQHRKIGGYSGGMKQRLGLAQALIHRPKLLILDEPVSALDPVGRRDVLELLRKLKQEMTMIFSTHVLHDAEEVCDDVLIIRKGQIEISGSLREVRAEHQQPVLIIQADDAEQLDGWVSGWLQHEYVVEAVQEHDTVKIAVTNLQKAKDMLLKDLVEKEISIRKFELAQTTLEDLFMKVVSSV